MIWRRKRLPPELTDAHRAFMATLAEVEPAKAALTRVMPTTRVPGTPLPDALVEFESGLVRARGSMEGWNVAALDPDWRACEAGIDEALSRATRLREDAPDLGGFEGLIWAVEHLLDPLDPFHDAAVRFRALRT
jgi:hypothetical protein